MSLSFTLKEYSLFFDLRQYRTLPGMRDKWVELIETEIFPFQISKGLVVTGNFVGEDKEDLYIWIRRFDSEEERERLYEAVYQRDYWKNSIDQRIPEYLDRRRAVVTRLEPTPKSAIL